MLYRRLIESRIEEDSDRVALTDGNRELTLGELHRLVGFEVNMLIEAGVVKGDRIIIISYNRVETIVALLACFATGCVAVPLHPEHREETIKAIQRECGARFILGDISGGYTIPLGEATEYPIDWKRGLVSEEDGCYILYTSGSTGVEKGIFAKLKQVLFCVDAIQKRIRYRKGDRILCCLPLSFDYGLYQLFLALDGGSLLCLAQSSPIQRFPALVSQLRITVLPAMASIINLLIKTGIWGEAGRETLRMITFTGEEIPEGLLQRLEEILPKTQIVPMYGLSECKRVAILPAERKDKREAGSCGLPLDGVTVRLLDMESKSGIGELVVEGPNVMEGYWNQPEETARVFGFNKETGQRFVKTGDRFRIDEEGFLYFCGRKSRLIKTGGIRFEPEGLERRISRLLGVIQCRVLGIRHSLYGEQICVCVYGTTNVLEQVKKEMSILPPYFPPCRLIYFDKPLPENQNGKIDLNSLKKWIEENG